MLTLLQFDVWALTYDLLLMVYGKAARALREASVNPHLHVYPNGWFASHMLNFFDEACRRTFSRHILGVHFLFFISWVKLQVISSTKCMWGIMQDASLMIFCAYAFAGWKGIFSSSCDSECCSFWKVSILDPGSAILHDLPPFHTSLYTPVLMSSFKLKLQCPQPWEHNSSRCVACPQSTTHKSLSGHLSHLCFCPKLRMKLIMQSTFCWHVMKLLSGHQSHSHLNVKMRTKAFFLSSSFRPVAICPPLSILTCWDWEVHLRFLSVTGWTTVCFPVAECRALSQYADAHLSAWRIVLAWFVIWPAHIGFLILNGRAQDSVSMCSFSLISNDES